VGALIRGDLVQHRQPVTTAGCGAWA
jgi:hypothetical protein